MAKPNQRVKVLRGFRHKQEIIGPGSVLDLELPLAVELRTANKVEFANADEKLVIKHELPDPNRVLAERQAVRAAALAATTAAATKSVAAGGR